MIHRWQTIVRYSAPLLTVCVFIELFAGQLLQENQDILVLFPIFLIAIPVINSVGGNIGSVLGARLASGLHVGYITPTVKDKEMRTNVLVAMLLGIITYTVLAILIYGIAVFGGLHAGIGLIEFVAVIVGAGFFLISVIVMISVLTAFVSFRKGLDPDDMVAPVVTTVGDVMGISFLLLVITIMGVGL